MSHCLQAASLSRYLTACLFAFASFDLLFFSLRSLRQRFHQQKSPYKGYFLLSERQGSDLEAASYPLYFTSILGRARSSDLRLTDRAVHRRHAQIYYYSGRWYLAPLSPTASLFLNQKEVHSKVKLKNGDRIDLPGHSFVFVDERESALLQGVDFEATWTEEASFASEQSSWPRKAFICYILWYLLQLFQAFAVMYPENPALALQYALYAAVFFILIIILRFLLSRLLSNFDQIIYAALAFLSSLGLLFQMRLSILNRGKPIDWTEQVWQQFLEKDLLKQFMLPVAGLLLIPFLASFAAKSRWPERFAPVSVLLTPAFYLATRVLGHDVASTGAELWIPLPGGLTIQLTEFAKIAYLFVLARFFMVQQNMKRQILFALWAAANVLLILMLPDLGSLMILLPVTLIVYIVMTSEYLKGLILLGGAGGLFAFAWRFFPYVQRRLYGWLTLWTEVNAQNDQIIRGLQAMSRGRWFGVGFGAAEPRFIPLASSDMIFTFMTEELGLVISLSALVLFFVIWIRSAFAVLALRDGFSASLILALSSCFLLEAAVVAGGSTGLIPLTGATLPFIARGGSSMLAKWMMAGLLLGLWSRREDEEGIE